jgi:hypothetical protein
MVIVVIITIIFNIITIMITVMTNFDIFLKENLEMVLGYRLVVEYLPSNCEAQGSIPSTKK